MPKPATTQPMSRIAAAPSSQPRTTNRTSTAPRPSQRPAEPIAGRAPWRAAPSAIRASSAPAPQLRLRRWQVVLAVHEPHLRAPDGRARARVVGRDGDRKPGPQRIEVEEERDRKAEVRHQQPAADGREARRELSEHESQREDHEDEAAEHVVHEKHPADVRPRQVLRYEPEQDHGGREAPVPDDEVREREYAGEARPPDPG